MTANVREKSFPDRRPAAAASDAAMELDPRYMELTRKNDGSHSNRHPTSGGIPREGGLSLSL